MICLCEQQTWSSTQEYKPTEDMSSARSNKAQVLLSGLKQK